MSQTASPPLASPAPRIERELALSPRLELEMLPATVAAVPNRQGPGTLALAGSGAALLVLGGAAVGVAGMVHTAFALSPALGFGSLGIATLGTALLGAGCWRELRGLWALRHVDHLRTALAGEQIVSVRAAAIDWIRSLPDQAALLPALRAADDVATIRGLLRAGPLSSMRVATDALSTAASLQVLAAVAAVPSPSFDGALVAWRGIRLIRQVADLHGLRPGALASFRLVRRTLLSAALVTATDIATNTAAHALISNKLLGHIVGDTTTALVAARRMRLLARAAAAACSPLDEASS